MMDEKIKQAIRELLRSAFADDTDHVKVTIKALVLWKRLHENHEAYVSFRADEVLP